MRAFISIDPQLFFKGSHKEDPRLGRSTHLINASEFAQAAPGVVLAGYPDEEGVRLNGGRLGAKEAPDEIRRYFYRGTVRGLNEVKLYDLGNLKIQDSLAQRHQRVKEAAETALNAGHCWLSMGGGHDYGYPDVAAFLNFCGRQKKRGLVLHFDAHLDCRPDDQNLNSGTPFYRVLNEYPTGSFDIIAIGLQRVCNSELYLQWARKRKMKIYFAHELKKAVAAIRPQLKRKRPVFISLDMDVFASPFAPGTSNNWPFGLTPNEVQELLNEVYKKSDVRGLGVYEVSPPLDVASGTSKLAAQIMVEFVHAIAERTQLS